MVTSSTPQLEGTVNVTPFKIGKADLDGNVSAFKAQLLTTQGEILKLKEIDIYKTDLAPDRKAQINDHLNQNIGRFFGHKPSIDTDKSQLDTSIFQYKPAQVLKENHKKHQDESPLIGRNMIQTKPMFSKSKPTTK